MEVFNATLTAATRLDGKVAPFLMIMLSKSCADQSSLIHDTLPF